MQPPLLRGRTGWGSRLTDGKLLPSATVRPVKHPSKTWVLQGAQRWPYARPARGCARSARGSGRTHLSFNRACQASSVGGRTRLQFRLHSKAFTNTAVLWESPCACRGDLQPNVLTSLYAESRARRFLRNTSMHMWSLAFSVRVSMSPHNWLPNSNSESPCACRREMTCS